MLSTGQPSQYSEQLLIRLGLSSRFDEEPETVLAGIRGPGVGLSREYLFVLSELSFFHAVQSQKPAQQMQASQMDTFNRAQATCLQARGYSVN